MMTTLTVLSVFDSVAGTFAKPFYALNKAVGIRMFRDAIESGDDSLCSHPEDYSLHFVGEFDYEQGVFVPPLDGLPVLLLPARQVMLTARADLTNTINPEDLVPLS